MQAGLNHLKACESGSIERCKGGFSSASLAVLSKQAVREGKTLEKHLIDMRAPTPQGEPILRVKHQKDIYALLQLNIPGTDRWLPFGMILEDGRWKATLDEEEVGKAFSAIYGESNGDNLNQKSIPKLKVNKDAKRENPQVGSGRGAKTE